MFSRRSDPPFFLPFLNFILAYISNVKKEKESKYRKIIKRKLLNPLVYEYILHEFL